MCNNFRDGFYPALICMCSKVGLGALSTDGTLSHSSVPYGLSQLGVLAAVGLTAVGVCYLLVL